MWSHGSRRSGRTSSWEDSNDRNRRTVATGVPGAARDRLQRARRRDAGRTDRPLHPLAITRERRPGYESWLSLGALDQFPEGQTRFATYRNPVVNPWDGETATIACWVRHLAGEKFQVFAINCAHLGCPVRWFPQSNLFMCPCHGGAYYADGSRASGPP